MLDTGDPVLSVDPFACSGQDEFSLRLSERGPDHRDRSGAVLALDLLAARFCDSIGAALVRCSDLALERRAGLLTIDLDLLRLQAPVLRRIELDLNLLVPWAPENR